MNTNLPKRKKLRLTEYDYSSPGAYFITICTKNHEKLLSEIVVGDGVLDDPQNTLTKYGQIAEKIITNLNEFYKNISIIKYVIMPNHIHMLIEITDTGGVPGTPPPTEYGNRNISAHNTNTRANTVIAKFVSAFKRFCDREYEKNIWQRSYHDRIIRNEPEYREIWEYIDTNPARWKTDCFYI